MTIKRVTLSDKLEKGLKKIPQNIIQRLKTWVEIVERDGLSEARKIKGFRDKKLQGKRKGQCSIRLNRAWRAIYTIKKETIEFVLIEEVNKHEY